MIKAFYFPNFQYINECWVAKKFLKPLNWTVSNSKRTISPAWEFVRIFIQKKIWALIWIKENFLFFINRILYLNHYTWKNCQLPGPIYSFIKPQPGFQIYSITLLYNLNWEDPPEEGMATHSSILAQRIPWTEEPGGLQSMGSQRVRHDWSDLARTQIILVRSKQQRQSHQAQRDSKFTSADFTCEQLWTLVSALPRCGLAGHRWLM